jgi:hypothetical protein
MSYTGHYLPEYVVRLVTDPSLPLSANARNIRSLMHRHAIPDEGKTDFWYAMTIAHYMRLREDKRLVAVRGFDLYLPASSNEHDRIAPLLPRLTQASPCVFMETARAISSALSHVRSGIIRLLCDYLLTMGAQHDEQG